MFQARPQTTVVVPVRHEAENIDSLLRRLNAAFAGSSQNQIEVLFVDDSDDLRTVEAFERAWREMRLVNLVVRYIHRTGAERWGGLAGAVVDGMRQAAGSSSCLVVMDGDGQHPSETVPSLVQHVLAGTDIVVASRYVSGGSAAGLDGIGRKIVSRAATVLSGALFPRGLRGISDPMTGFFALKRSSLKMEKLEHVRGYKILLEILVSHPRMKRQEIPFDFLPRSHGESKAGEGNGTEFLRQLLRLRMRTLPTALMFMLGGGLIAAFGALMLWVMVGLGVNPLAANAAQLGATLVLNFIYNRQVTWRGQSSGRLKRQIVAFVVTRGFTQVLSWSAFTALMVVGSRYRVLEIAWRAQIANLVATTVVMVANYMTSKHLVFASSSGRGKRSKALAAALVMLATSGGLLVAVMTTGLKAVFVGLILVYAVFGFVTSALEIRWRLYGRRTPEVQAAMKFPKPVPPAQASCWFSVIVAALDEPAVIGQTLRRLIGQTHPRVQIVVSLVEGDEPTITAVMTVARAFPGRLHVIVRKYEKGSKAQQLNAALPVCTGEYVTVFDAETKVPEELFAHVEAKIRETGADVVQAGVQLVNLGLRRPRSWNRLERFPRLQRCLSPFFTSRLWTAMRGWYCVHNVLEYFFWFSSRMFYQADQGFVPLGGNTVFIRRSLLEKVGGWPDTLTEDCALGTKLSLIGVKIVAVYEPALASREETPSHIFGKGGLEPQRCRWDQGFWEVLLEGQWRQLPTMKKRLMALYILGMPLIQAINGLFVPVALVSFFFMTAPVGLVLVMFLPFIPMTMSVAVQVVGLREFSREFEQKAGFRHYASLIFMNLPYQILLAWPAVRAIWRHTRGQTGWAKTRHDGMHFDEELTELVGVEI